MTYLLNFLGKRMKWNIIKIIRKWNERNQNRINFFYWSIYKIIKKLNKNEIDSFDMFTDCEEIEWNMCVHYSWLNSNVT